MKKYPQNLVRSVCILIRVTPEEKEWIRLFAKREGRSVSNYIRRQALTPK